MNAPSIFQRMMDQICVDLPLVRVYHDYCVVFSTSLQEHMNHRHELFEKISKHNLKDKISKFIFEKP